MYFDGTYLIMKNHILMSHLNDCNTTTTSDEIIVFAVTRKLTRVGGQYRHGHMSTTRINI